LTTEPARLDLLGFPVDLVDRDALIAWLTTTLTTSPTCRHLVTLNPEYVMQARRDRAFATAIRAADLVVADGVGVAKAATWLRSARGNPGVVPRIPGVEIVELIASLPREVAGGIFLLGARAGIAEIAAAVLAERYPGVEICGAWDGGSPLAIHDEESRRRIAQSGARVVLVAYGASGQIGWIVRNQEALSAMGVRLAIGVGGAFDFISGEVTRAPGMVQRLGLEWLYRLVREPWRWRRQVVLPHFALLALLQVLRERRGR